MRMTLLFQLLKLPLLSKKLQMNLEVADLMLSLKRLLLLSKLQYLKSTNEAFLMSTHNLICLWTNKKIINTFLNERCFIWGYGY